MKNVVSFCPFSSSPTSAAGGFSIMCSPTLHLCFELQLVHIFIIKISLSLCPPSCASHPNSQYESRKVDTFKIKNCLCSPCSPVFSFHPSPRLHWNISWRAPEFLLSWRRLIHPTSASVFWEQHITRAPSRDVRSLCHTCLRQSEETGIKGPGKLDGDSFLYLLEATKHSNGLHRHGMEDLREGHRLLLRKTKLMKGKGENVSYER